MLLVVLNQIGSHLQRAVKGDIKSQLLGKRSLHLPMRQIAHKIQFGIENARSVVHRATDKTVKGKQCGVERLATAKGFIFGSAGRFVANQVRIGAAQPCGAYGFVAVDANLIIGGFLHGIEIVVVHPLSVVVFSARNDIAYIAAFHCIIAIIHHKLIGFVHVAFVIADGRRCFMMHHQLHTFALGVSVQHLYIEIGVWGYKVENIIFGMSEPVFPAFVPTFHQHLVETVGSRKVDISLHVFIVGAMTSVGLCLGIVRFAQFDGGQFVRICPSAFAGNHFPPYAYIFHRFNPRNIFIGTRFIQVQSQLGSKDVACVIADNNRTPWRLAGSLHIAFVTHCIGGQPRLKNQVLVVQVQVHTRIVHQSCFMQVDVQSVCRLHLKGGLHTCRRELCLRGVACDSFLHQSAYFGKFGLHVVILLRIVVARYPKRLMVARHSKLGTFFLDNKVVQVLLQRELVTEAETVVKEAETNDDIAVLRLLIQRYGHFIIVVTDLFYFTPHRFPGFIKRRGFGTGQSKSVHQSRIIFQFQTEFRGLNNRFSFVGKFVNRFTLGIYRKVQSELAVRRSNALGHCCAAHEKGEQEAGQFSENSLHVSHAMVF